MIRVQGSLTQACCHAPANRSRSAEAMSQETRTTLALAEVAREFGLAVGHRAIYPGGHAMVALVDPADPEHVVGMLPIDQTLLVRMTEGQHTRAGLRRILRNDAFQDRAMSDPARDLCRLGLVACHALSEALPVTAIAAAVHARVLFHEPGIEATSSFPAMTVSLGGDQVRLLWQFNPVERFGRAYHLFRRQIAVADAQRASS